MKFSALAKSLGLPSEDLKELIIGEGLEVDIDNGEITAEDADKVREAFGNADEAEVYEEMVEAEKERERRKDNKKKKATSANAKKHSKAGADARNFNQISKNIEIGESISVKEFAEKTNIPVVKVIGDLMKAGILATMNQEIDYDTAALVADNYGVKIAKIISGGSAEDLLEGNLAHLLAQDEKENLITRPPVVTVMGHVDHGKTSILDVIRKTKVTEGESGGITQHIGAYQAKMDDGRMVTFLDTPGHEAFTEMRARGAQCTDVAVLVVAASEGIKPQTIESINHAKDAGVPVVVALNKMDLPDANPDRVKGELAEHGLQAEDWGGDTPMVPVSALKGMGIDTLLETILVVADMKDLRANPSRQAVATVIEAHLDAGLGPVATVLVNTGTLHIKDDFVVGETFGKVKSMVTDNGNHLSKAEPSTPIRLAGFDRTPHVGDILQVMSDEKSARKKASEVAHLRTSRRELEGAKGMAQIIASIQAGKMKELKIILKADTNGSLEAVKSSLSDIKNEEVVTKVIHSGVGAINESDVAMAEAGNAVVLGFHSKPNALAEARAQKSGVEVLSYTVIYKLLEDTKKILQGLLEPEDVAVELGEATVLAIFFTKKKEMIVGCKIQNGKAVNHAKVRVKRDGKLVGEGDIRSLQIEKDNANEVAEGRECGIRFSGAMKIEEGDRLQFYKVERKIKTL